jgi:hypothetical protein
MNMAGHLWPSNSSATSKRSFSLFVCALLFLHFFFLKDYLQLGYPCIGQTSHHSGIIHIHWMLLQASPFRNERSYMIAPPSNVGSVQIKLMVLLNT